MKVCFIYSPETNERFLEIIRKMTPDRSGKWKDMEATINLDEADWFVVIDDTPLNLPEERTLYICAHPYIKGYSGYKDQSKHKHKLDLRDTFGFGEWWLNYDYDYLTNLKKPEKTKETCFILSNAEGDYGRTQRKLFAKHLEQQGINVYGRIKGVGKGELGINDKNNYWFGKEEVLRQHKYSIEIDIGHTLNYFSERVFDSLLMWCKPLYWGSTNVEQYLPKDSFQYIDIYADRLPELQPINYLAIKEARDLLLNKYQLWPRVYNFICG